MTYLVELAFNFQSIGILTWNFSFFVIFRKKVTQPLQKNFSKKSDVTPTKIESKKSDLTPTKIEKYGQKINFPKNDEDRKKFS